MSVPRVLGSFPPRDGAEPESHAFISLQTSGDHASHTTALGAGALRCLPVCFRCRNSGDTAPGFPNTERWSVSNRKGLSFLSESGSCVPGPAPSCRHLAFSRFNKEQISPRSLYLSVCVIFYSNRKQDSLFLSSATVILSFQSQQLCKISD